MSASGPGCRIKGDKPSLNIAPIRPATRPVSAASTVSCHDDQSAVLKKEENALSRKRKATSGGRAETAFIPKVDHSENWDRSGESGAGTDFCAGLRSEGSRDDRTFPCSRENKAVGARVEV